MNETPKFELLTDAQIAELCAGVMGWRTKIEILDGMRFNYWADENGDLARIKRNYDPANNPAQALEMLWTLDYGQRYLIRGELGIYSANDNAEFCRAVCEAVLRAKGLVR